ncbi:GSU3473 family protein [Geopsychrobacter electrodiphilus]|uniref:GSU3473 family protein n=1 Tax=Geopsychrobacter electrodiphilus TaxID=225196 RepID=UPI00037C5CEB|nr:hypothetical protein [Geopsychrobacter electrodiphilus]
MEEIEVIYNDGMFGFVKPAELNHLIETAGIVKFMRGDSWIYLGVDATRSGQPSRPQFRDRRAGL